MIWLGLDGADWEHLGSLASGGTVPNWKRLADGGFCARLESFQPMLSPLLWTTQETGVGPDVHRVLDFQEIDAGGVLGPVSERSRKVPAVWNIVSQLGGKVGVVGFWATHPAEVVNGFFLSNRIDASSPPQVPGGVGFPTSLDATVRQVVARDGQVSASDLMPYFNAPASQLESAIAKQEGYNNPVTALAGLLGTTRVTQRLARELYDRELPEFLAVYFEGTDSVGHLFGRYAPPKLPCVTDAEFAMLQRVPESYFAALDRMLGQWMRRAQEDGAILVVTSDHGFRWGADRPCNRSGTEEATAATWHRSPGVFLAWGKDVRPQALSSTAPATQFDVAPTLLALLGAPVDRRMRGRVLPLGPVAAPERRDFFGTIAVSTVPSQNLDPKSASEYAKKLAALGYISASAGQSVQPPPSAAGLTKSGWNNLGVYLRFTAGDERGAREAWTEALKLDPAYHSPLLNLAMVARDHGDRAEASRLLLRSIAAGDPNPEVTVERWAGEFEKSDPKAALDLLRRAHTAYPASEAYAGDYALLLKRLGRCREASSVLASFEQSSRPATLNAAAIVEACLDRPDRARAFLTRSLALDPNQPRVREALESIPR